MNDRPQPPNRRDKATVTTLAGQTDREAKEMGRRRSAVQSLVVTLQFSASRDRSTLVSTVDGEADSDGEICRSPRFVCALATTTEETIGE